MFLTQEESIFPYKNPQISRKVLMSKYFTQKTKKVFIAIKIMQEEKKKKDRSLFKHTY